MYNRFRVGTSAFGGWVDYGLLLQTMENVLVFQIRI
jgi:hypothetical protein